MILFNFDYSSPIILSAYFNKSSLYFSIQYLTSVTKGKFLWETLNSSFILVVIKYGHSTHKKGARLKFMLPTTERASIRLRNSLFDCKFSLIADILRTCWITAYPL